MFAIVKEDGKIVKSIVTSSFEDNQYKNKIFEFEILDCIKYTIFNKYFVRMKDDPTIVGDACYMHDTKEFKVSALRKIGEGRFEFQNTKQAAWYWGYINFKE